MGYGFRLSFKGENGNEIDALTVNSPNTVRKGLFFYRCGAQLCFGELKALEDKYCG